jgi:hypothetical protein
MSWRSRKTAVHEAAHAVMAVNGNMLVRKWRRRQNALRKTAIHEGAHAVIAFMEHIPFRTVTVRPKAETLGRVLFRTWPAWASPDSEKYNPRRARWWFEGRTRVAFAGQIAEQIYAGRRPARFSHSQDDETAVSLATDMCGSVEECSAWLTLLFIQTRNRLDLPHIWPAVEALAEQLMKLETIGGSAAKAIIRAALTQGSR